MGTYEDNYDSLDYRKFTLARSEFDKAIHTLDGILKGISIDGNINQQEIMELNFWCSKYSHYKYTHPFNELIPLISKSIEDHLLDEEELKDILWLCNRFKTDNIYFDIITSDIQRLHGILHGILSDNNIALDEIKALGRWLEENEHLVKTYPYDEIYSLIISVLSDNVLSDDEKKFLKLFFSEFVDINNCPTNIDLKEILQLKQNITINGICSVCPEITIVNNVFCFTGISSKTTRNTIADTIESLGGLYKNSVTKKTNYLIVGNEGNPCWSFSCYGRKVEAAVNLRKEGHQILIVHENDFWDVLDSLI
ncbi:MAG: NAD-dependent DNA ligase [Candidatus Methanofastidiosum sp.]|nr:NAD-dependent DNA ligase [Methanofastidiosum sp.]